MYGSGPLAFYTSLFYDVHYCLSALNFSVKSRLGKVYSMFTCRARVAQSCSLSSVLFSVFINGLLKEVEE